MKEGTSPEVPKARERRGEPRVGRVRGSGPCRGVIERPGGSRHDTQQGLEVEQDLLCSNRGFIDLTECSEELLGAIVKKEDW